MLIQKTEKTELYSNVNDVNSILKQIGLLNEKMQKFDGVSNDMLDKRDQLELELSNYVDIDVERTDDNYELKIGGESVVSNTNVRTLNVNEEETLQKDKFTLVDSSVYPPTVYDSLKYNSDFSAKTFDANDVVTYKLNNQFFVSVAMGESITMDWNGDGTETTETVDSSNLTRALVHKINSDANMKDSITAYNGDYSVDANGNKVTINTQDNYLRIESNFGGSQKQFDGRISIENINNTDSTIVDKRESIYKNNLESTNPESKVFITINDREIPIKGGILKAQVENLSSDSLNNKYQTYLNKLDTFAQTLSDISDKFIKTSSGDYIYGEAATDESLGTINSMKLFSGSSVKTLKFNDNMVNDLDQTKLDYLASIQWKQNISFDGKAQDSNSTSKASLSEFFRDLRVIVSADKENIDFSKTTQSGISNSIKSSYDQLTKVDKDEEMLNLIKFQAAYTANAKMITTIDEMLQTLLGLKR
jgi:flagellar hook-associated protein 1